MTNHEHTAKEAAERLQAWLDADDATHFGQHENDILALLEERDRLREALENARRAIRMWKGKGEPGFVEVSAALHGALRDLDAALEDKQ